MIRWALVVLFLALPASAQAFPEPLSDTVSDYAGLLPPEDEARLTDTLRRARDETGVHIVVATIERKADYGGGSRSIERFAKDWFNAWGIGDPERNDGILILVARTDREVRIALGAGFDPRYDGHAQRVIDTAMLPSFRQSRYAEGIAAGVDGTIERLARPFAARTVPEPVSAPPPAGSRPGDAPEPAFLLLLAAFAGFLLWRSRSLIADVGLRLRRCPSCGALGLRGRRDVVMPPTTENFGEGARTIRCPSCGDERRETYPLAPLRTSSGRHGGGGFGGGRSSGGGASGRW